MNRGLLHLLLCLVLVFMGTPAWAHCRPETRVGGSPVFSSDFASQESVKPIAASSENPACGYDFASGVHKYLYAQNDPVDNDNPLGLYILGPYTGNEGDALHALIQADYALELGTTCPNTTYGKPAGIGKNTRLQPDILNKDAKTYAEIKPLSPSGIRHGWEQLKEYDDSLKYLGYKRDWWPWGTIPPVRITYYNYAPYFYFNVDGLILYTRIDPGLLGIPIVKGMSKKALEDLAAKSAARLATQGATTLTQIVGQRAASVNTFNGAQLEEDEDDAAEFSSMGVN